MALDFEESKQNCEERPTTVLFIVFENMKVKNQEVFVNTYFYLVEQTQLI